MGIRFCKQLMQRRFFKGMDAQKLQGSVQGAGQLELLVEDGDYQADRHGNPDLRLHGVGTGAEEVADAQVAFDPAEEECDLPAQAVSLGDSPSRDVEMVGQENQVAASFGIEVAHFAQRPGKILARGRQRRFAHLIAAHSAGIVKRPRALTGKTQVVLGARDEKASRSGDVSEACKVHVAAIHDMESPGFEEERVEPEHVVLPGVGDMDAGGNRAAQIQLRVHFHAGLGPAEIGPREQGQRQVDGRGVQGMDRVLQIDPQVLPGIELPGLGHEPPGQVLPHPPIAPLVGLGERGARHGWAEARMVKRLGSGIQTGLDVAQALPPGELREDHADELLPAAEMPHPRLRAIALDQASQRLPVNQTPRTCERT